MIIYDFTTLNYLYFVLMVFILAALAFRFASQTKTGKAREKDTSVIPECTELIAQLLKAGNDAKAKHRKSQLELITSEVTASLKAGKIGKEVLLYRNLKDNLDPLVVAEAKEAFAAKGWALSFMYLTEGYAVTLIGTSLDTLFPTLTADS